MLRRPATWPINRLSRYFSHDILLLNLKKVVNRVDREFVLTFAVRKMELSQVIRSKEKSALKLWALIFLKREAVCVVSAAALRLPPLSVSAHAPLIFRWKGTSMGFTSGTPTVRTRTLYDGIKPEQIRYTRDNRFKCLRPTPNHETHGF